MTIYRGPGGTGSATSDADTTLYQDFLNQTEAARDAAAVSASDASTSASTAATQASNAASSASAASSSASAAATSASTASTKASEASASASSASVSAAAADASAVSAAASAASINPALFMHLAGTETVTGSKTFSSLITGDISGNAGTVTNGVYLNSTQTLTNKTLTTPSISSPTISDGTANGVPYLNASKVLTSGSALTFNGSSLGMPNIDLGGTAGNGILNLYAPGFANYFQIVNASTALTFGYNGTEQMRLTSTGLGIGTSSITAKLDVSGAAASAAITGSITNTDASGFSVLRLRNTGASGKEYQIVVGGHSSASVDNFYIYDATAAAVRLTLDTSGNLGLGVTPSAWGSGYKALQMPWGTFASENVVHGQALLLTNAYNAGSQSAPSWKYVSTANSALSYIQDVADAQHRWYTASSGTAGAAITFTQAMTLDASGNLLVGTASSIFGAANRGSIQVNGTSQAILGLGINGGDGGYVYHNGVDISLWNSKTGAMLLGTSGTERARIDSSGNLLAGVTSGTRHWLSKNNAADYAVTINNTNANPLGAQILHSTDSNGTGNQFLVCFGSATVRAEIRSNGGLANYSANNVNLSDVRTKTDIQDAPSYLAKICAIPVRTFKYKDQTDDQLNLGAIAQEVEAVAPELVDVSGFGETPEDGIPLKAIYQTDLQYALMKCIQEQQALINAQAAALESLAARITALDARLVSLEAK